MSSSIEIDETQSNLVAEGTLLEGKLCFDKVTRVQGTLKGEISTKEDSLLILGESALVEGDINADEVWVSGYVDGNIRARSKVVITGTGRVTGQISSPSLKVDFGAFFEGDCSMEEHMSPGSPKITSGPSPELA